MTRKHCKAKPFKIQKKPSAYSNSTEKAFDIVINSTSNISIKQNIVLGIS